MLIIDVESVPVIHVIQMAARLVGDIDMIKVIDCVGDRFIHKDVHAQRKTKIALIKIWLEQNA